MGGDPSFGAAYGIAGGGDQGDLLGYLDAVAAVPAFREAKSAGTAALELGPGDQVLEVGCGTGVDLGPLLEAVGPAGGVVGLDHDGDALEVARHRFGSAPGPHLIEARIEDLPFRPGTFDAVRADRTIQHVPRPVEALTELHRVLHRLKIPIPIRGNGNPPLTSLRRINDATPDQDAEPRDVAAHRRGHDVRGGGAGPGGASLCPDAGQRAEVASIASGNLRSRNR